MVNAVGRAGIPAALLAHQGGWDEMLLVAGPIVVVVALVWLARRRATSAPGASGDHAGTGAADGLDGVDTPR